MPAFADASKPRLLIVGASTRAAAQSALRGGFAPVCVDLYGDADLRRCAEVITVTDMPAEAPTAVAGLPQMPWMYCGGLENHPETVARIAACPSIDGGSGFHLRGIAAETLISVRSPWWLAECLRRAGLLTLGVWPKEKPAPPCDGQWLQKPLRGAGGRAISIWGASALPLREPHYFQRLITGQAYSAQFLALPGKTVLLGITRQLVGLPEVHAAPFAWCGALAPASIGQDTLKTMRQTGEAISSAAGLQGLFGCDFVVEGTTPWLTEVNPRYTAAMELLDYLHQTSLVRWHMWACTQFVREYAGPPTPEPHRCGQSWHISSQPRVVGKIVLFADVDCTMADATSLLRDPHDDRLPLIADVPAPGARISRGFPICTLFAASASEDALIARLLCRAAEFRGRYLCASDE